MNRFERFLTIALLALHTRLYESAVATGTILGLVYCWRLILYKKKSERVLNAISFLLTLVSVLIAAKWILAPRDAGNLDNFLSAILDGLLHPYSLIGLSFVLLTGLGKAMHSPLLINGGLVVPIGIGIISMFRSGIPAIDGFNSRTLSLTGLPLLAIVCIAFTAFRPSVSQNLVWKVVGIVGLLAILNVRHLEDWYAFSQRFQKILRTERGFILPEDHEGLTHWGWTNPSLSYVWSRGRVNGVILNPSGSTGWVPFDPKTEVVMKKYLVTLPDFLQD
jgi:hypothetical protein